MFDVDAAHRSNLLFQLASSEVLNVALGYPVPLAVKVASTNDPLEFIPNKIEQYSTHITGPPPHTPWKIWSWDLPIRLESYRGNRNTHGLKMNFNAHQTPYLSRFELIRYCKGANRFASAQTSPMLSCSNWAMGFKSPGICGLYRKSRWTGAEAAWVSKTSRRAFANPAGYVLGRVGEERPQINWYRSGWQSLPWNSNQIPYACHGSEILWVPQFQRNVYVLLNRCTFLSFHIMACLELILELSFRICAYKFRVVLRVLRFSFSAFRSAPRWSFWIPNILL